MTADREPVVSERKGDEKFIEKIRKKRVDFFRSGRHKAANGTQRTTAKRLREESLVA
jgi:hypothetical protein